MKTRRPKRPLALFAALAATAIALTACGGSSSGGSEDTAAGSEDSGPWTYTDDIGKTVTLDHKPTKIAGLNDVLVSLMHYGLDPVASFGWASVQDDPRFADYDVSGITTIGATYGEIDEEKLIETAPDVIISTIYPTDEKGTLPDPELIYGFNDITQQEKIAKIAPIITLYMGGDGADVMESVTKLSVALGADQAVIDKAKTEYEAAAAELKTAAADTDITATVLYGDADGAYVAKADDDPALRLYKNLGVKFFEPTPDGYYWGIYSWENAGKIGGDLILLSESGYQKAEILKQPTLAQTRAATADQIQPWVNTGLDYVGQTTYVKQLAGYLSGAKVVTS